MVVTSTTTLMELCRRAVLSSGGDMNMAESLARSAVDAESTGKPALGILHLFDYLDSLREGRINAGARPLITRPVPAAFVADADGGVPHVAFDMVVDALTEAARTLGVAIFSQRNAYTCGALGHFVGRIASQGLVAFGGANCQALMSAGGSRRAVLGTNPIAFAAPRAGLPPLVIDQASSEAAFVKIRDAAHTKTPIPKGWALDREGAPTSDAEAALEGVLLPFGGFKGSNIALMVEMLSTLSGANWSLDAAPFDTGTSSPSVGMFLICIDPKLFDPEFCTRLTSHLKRLRDGFNVRLPGATRMTEGPAETCEVPAEIMTRLQAASA